MKHELRRTLTLFGLLSALILPVFLMPVEVKAVTPIITGIPTSSIDRTWEDVSILYPNLYLNSSMVQQEVENIHSNVPELVDVDVIGQSYEGRDILSVRITNEEAPQQKAKTLVVAHHHGREKVTVNTAIYFMQWLVNSYGVDSQITEYIDTQEIYVIPTMNPDALNFIYNYSDHWLRKNLRPYDDDGDGLVDEDPYDDANDDGYVTQWEVYEKGPGGHLNYLYSYYEGDDDDGDGLYNEDWVGLVDLNRNYASNWGIEPTASLDSMSQVYAGELPFSEPETQAFRDFALNHKFGMAYSLHTGINATYFVTNNYGDWAQGALYSQMWNDYKDILPPNFNYYLDFSANNNHARAPSINSGGWEEWMYHVLDCLAPITFEIYNNASSESEELYYIHEENSTHLIMEWNGIYEYFSPDEPYIESLWLDLIPSFEYLLEQTPRISVSIYNAYLLDTTITMVLAVNCLSPRIETIDTLEARLLDGTLMDFMPPVDADSTVSTEMYFEFESIEVHDNITFRIGNEFTGYSRFIISFVDSGPLDPLIIGGVTIAIVAVVVAIVYFIRKR